MYSQTNAADLNAYLCKSLFDSPNAKVSLVKPWGYECKDARQYMQQNGVDVLRKSIRAFVDGDVLHHTCICASNKTGLLVADSRLISTLKLLTHSTNDNVCYRQIKQAVKRSILKPAILNHLPKIQRPTIATKTNIVPQHSITLRNDTPPNDTVEQTGTPEPMCMDMLVDTCNNDNDNAEDQYADTITLENDAQPKKKRRKRKQ